MTVATLLAVMNLGTLVGLRLQDDGSETSRWVYGDARPTLRALEAIFGHEGGRIAGRKLAYTMTDFGTLATLADPDEVGDDAAEAGEGEPLGG